MDVHLLLAECLLRLWALNEAEAWICLKAQDNACVLFRGVNRPRCRQRRFTFQDMLSLLCQLCQTACEGGLGHALRIEDNPEHHGVPDLQAPEVLIGQLHLARLLALNGPAKRGADQLRYDADISSGL